jgi:hypothetical protein
MPMTLSEAMVESTNSSVASFASWFSYGALFLTLPCTQRSMKQMMGPDAHR